MQSFAYSVIKKRSIQQPEYKAICAQKQQRIERVPDNLYGKTNKQQQKASYKPPTTKATYKQKYNIVLCFLCVYP